MGGTDSPLTSPMSQRYASPLIPSHRTPDQQRQLPSTPVVIPATPSPAPGPSFASKHQQQPAILSPSPSYLDYDPEDADHQTKRRSMYRSPGTSSSPDLATLLRKAKEKGGMINLGSRKERRESPPPLPRAFDGGASGRNRASTSSQGMPIASKGNGSISNNPQSSLEPTNSDRGAPSPLSKQPTRDGSGPPSKGGKGTVRSKTSAFLGKMLGQSSTRERSKTDAKAPSAPSTPSFFDAFTPPVPPLPPDIQQHSVPGTPNLAKPLPDAPTPTMSDIDASVVMIHRGTIPGSADESTVRRSKRRSMSVCETDLKNAMAGSSSSTPLPQSVEKPRKRESFSWGESSLNGIISEFNRELDQLDPTSAESPLDLRDPSTPARRTAYSRSQTDEPRTSEPRVEPRGTMTRSVTSPSRAPPTLVLQPPASYATDNAPIVPPRSSSLHTPVKTNNANPSSPTSWRPSSSSTYRVRNGSNYTSPLATTPNGTKLRVQHNSSASTSEPSLLPPHEDSKARDRRSSVRLLPSSNQPSEEALVSSPRDLSSSDVALTGSTSPTSVEEPLDFEERGRDIATRCWEEDEEFLSKDKIAEWLGRHGPINKVSLHYYMLNFDFSSLRLDIAFRRMCSKLYLKAETQQVDRILEEFSKRYWDCNPNTLFGNASVVHAVTYSLLLLNTDLHVADLVTRMSRNQFVRNTLSTIQLQLRPEAQHSTGNLNPEDDVFNSIPVNLDSQLTMRKTRSDSITSWNSISRDVGTSSQVSVAAGGRASNGSNTSVHNSPDPKSSFTYGRAWENDMENLLREMYNSVKNQQILQPQSIYGAARSSTSSLRAGSGAMLRNRSTRGPSDRLTTLRRGSIRGLQSIMSSQSGASPYSSNSSVDGRISPSPSFATSTHEMLYGGLMPPTLGFALNLSTTIIRETQEDDDRSVRSDGSGSTSISITDDELALLGAPWAKEGMLCRKQYWESAGKRARDKSWLDVFVVISKGDLNMFTFGDHGGGGFGVVGGGNWLENANSVGTVHLAHSLAHALPRPGYNRQRPHCMVLTLANGGVYFFQAGTEELVNEWVSTCNYWAARTSKEPLAGGVSNMEYGWNRIDDVEAHGRSASTNDADIFDTMSVRSGKSTRSKFAGFGTMRASESPWSDKTYINDWKPPQPPVVSSDHDEEGQMEALQKHVNSMKTDLKHHNELREPMLNLYQPRSANAAKAQANWEKKSQYLLTEIVKYDSYIDSLQRAMALRFKRRGEKALERALNGSTPGDNQSTTNSSKWKGYPDGGTIPEAEEPATPGPTNQEFSSSNLHKRESAEAGGS